jgi:hypothetical protein
MKPTNKHKTHKPSKGERLGWAPLVDHSSQRITDQMVKGRSISENEIKSRQALHNIKNNLLVP